MSRLEWLEKQIEIQSEAIVKAKDRNSVLTHSYLLEKLTDEWCALIQKEIRR